VPRRTTLRTGWRPYATVGPVTLHYPGEVIEVVGLHQSGHDGAQPQQPAAAPPGRIGRLDPRGRGTDPQGAADVVVDPTRPVRAPVTGTVVRAGTYTLYCDHVDEYLVVEPDDRPGWQVKMLHVEGLFVAQGDRVQAGVTVVGSRARVLPFASQVDRHTAEPHWPHLHIEVVDTAIEDRPSGATCD
jgi:murein DD-endopeptidase MepM/ murein hydrolase activator NlpD